MNDVKSILVLDDSRFILSWTKAALEAAGYGVEIASSVWSARQLAEADPDLVLMDVRFTEEFKEGVAATKSLKRDASTKHIPIVLYSILEEEILRGLVESSGANGFIRKSEDPHELVQLVTYYLSEAELENMERTQSARS